MKKLKNAAFMLAAVLVSVLFFYVNAEAADVAINSTNFPDAKFQAYVKSNFDKNKDNKLSAAEIKAVTNIDVSNKGITNLKGIERFTNLKALFCDGNKLTELNVSKNTKLKTLSCEENKLTKLDISAIPEIFRVYCSGNNISKLDISANRRLERAYHHYEEWWTGDGYHSYTFYDWDAPMSDYDLEEGEDIGDMAVDYHIRIDYFTKIVCGPKITTPEWNTSKTVTAGKKVSLKVKASGTGLKYQWFYKKPGSNKLIKVSAKAGRKATYTFTAKARHAGYTYICKVTNKNGTTQSPEISLLVKVKPKITSPKKATTKTLAVGKLASFKIKATGASAYQWEYRTSKTAPWQPVTLASGKTANYKLTVQARHNGYQYRCKVTNVGGQYVYSKIFTLKVKS